MKMIQKITIALAALLLSLGAMAQNQIHGTVCDSEGAPLPGAAVMIKGSTSGTVTDIDGKFSLPAKKGNKLEISFLGFASQTIDVTDAAEYKINLESDNAFLEETVVVGYGTQKRVNLTGSVASVSSKDFENKPIVSSSTALQGVAAGVTVTTQSGAPGADGGTIRIRGLGTFGNSSCAPLVLIDGVEGSLDAVEATQIDKISVLKDAASSAIYGSRAANGVILVTTKRAAKGTRSVSYRGYAGWQEPTCLPEMVGVQDYMRLNNEESVNDGAVPTYSEDYINNYFANNAIDPDSYPITDWQKQILTGSGFTQNHSINLVAGGEKIRVNTSVAYLGQDGIIKNTNYYRINFRNNMDVQILKELKMKVDISASYGCRNRLKQQNAIFADLTRRDPLTLTQWSTGYYAALSGGSLNSLSCLDGQGGNIKNDTYRFNGSLTLTWDPLDWLTVEGMVAPRLTFTETHDFEKKLTWYSDAFGTKSPYSNCEDSNLSESTGRGYYGNYNVTVNFHKTWANTHHFKALLGFSREDYSGKSLSATRYGYPYPDYEVINAGSDDARKTNSGSRNQWGLSSFFGRINYNYKDRYLFEANVRVDGSSRFAEGKKWGVFPSFSGAWRLSEEPFMKEAKEVMTEAKIRASYGQLGNQDIGSYYPAYQTLNIGSAISVNDVVTPIATLTTLANPDITWETTEMTDIGLDFAFWNKWSITADVYYKLTHGILLQIDIPQSIGLGAPYQNVGEVRNIGWEFSTGYHDNIGDWRWGVDFNISDVYNKILDMGGTISGSVIRQEAGHEINSIYGLVCNGIVRSQAQAEEINATCPQYGLTVKPGDLYYADIAGATDENGNSIPDGKVDDQDKTYIGTTIPHLTYGVTLSFGWKGINFSAFFQGVGQANAILNSYYIYPGYSGGSYRAEVMGRYNPSDASTWETATYPRLTKSDAISYRESTFWMADASYCRLKNIQLSYTFPKKWMSKAKIKDLTIFANGQNVYTWTNFYQGYDPELSYSGSSVTSGSAYNYPQVRTWTFGLDIKF